MENLKLEEIYFPNSWEDLILPVRVLGELKTVKERKSKKGYRLLLHSSPGTGKTSTSRIITIGDDILYLSGSNDFKIDTIRSKIMPFASGHSVLGKQKTVVIDEAENIRNNLQDTFKIILDQCDDVNFIFITNHFNEMNEAIVSRCTCIDYDFTGSEMEEQKGKYVGFAVKVCQEQKIPFENRALKDLCLRNLPDFRHLLVELQTILDRGTGVTEQVVKDLSITSKEMPELYELVMSPAIQAENLYAEVVLLKGKEKECLIALGEPFFNHLNSENRFDLTLQAAIIISKYSDSYVASINKFVTLLSCIVELKSLFK